MSSQAWDYLYTLISLIALVSLLYLADYLSKSGLFDPLTVENIKIPPLLLAVTSTKSHPHRSQLMEDTFDYAQGRGVVEDYPGLLTDTIIARGERIGMYDAPPDPFMHTTALEGIIIDTDSRVSEERIPQWEKRFSAIENVSVQIVNPGQCLTVSAPFRSGKLAPYILRWRLLRRLQKRCAKNSIATNTVIYAASIKRSRVLAAVPIAPLKSD